MFAILEGTKAEFGFTDKERFLSYLSLALAAKRAYPVAVALLGTRIFFACSLGTFRADLQRARPTAFI